MVIHWCDALSKSCVEISSNMLGIWIVWICLRSLSDKGRWWEGVQRTVFWMTGYSFYCTTEISVRENDRNIQTINIFDFKETICYWLGYWNSKQWIIFRVYVSTWIAILFMIEKLSWLAQNCFSFQCSLCLFFGCKDIRLVNSFYCSC